MIDIVDSKANISRIIQLIPDEDLVIAIVFIEMGKLICPGLSIVIAYIIIRKTTDHTHIGLVVNGRLQGYQYALPYPVGGLQVIAWYYGRGVVDVCNCDGEVGCSGSGVGISIDTVGVGTVLCYREAACI